MKLFYTRPGQGVVECCVMIDGQFHMKKISPDQAIQFASDLLDQAIESKRRLPTGTTKVNLFKLATTKVR